MKQMISIPIYIYDGDKTERLESLGLKPTNEHYVSTLNTTKDAIEGYWISPVEEENHDIYIYTTFGSFVSPYKNSTVELLKTILNERMEME